MEINIIMTDNQAPSVKTRRGRIVLVAGRFSVLAGNMI
jgi:hypothetical protein